MTQEPYESCLDYIEDEMTRYLPMRSARIDAECQLSGLSRATPNKRTVGDKQQVLQKELERRVHQYRKQEDDIRDEIDVRLELTRNVKGNESGISFDLLNCGLGANARLILLTLTANALGMGANTIGEIGFNYFSSVSVGDLMVMLSAKTVSDRLKVRRLILDMSGMGLVVLDYPSKSVTPGDLNSSDVTISRQTFAVILGDPSLEHESVTSKQSH